jgi:integrase
LTKNARLLDHGLRVGEIAILTRKNFDLKQGTLTFYRPKVNKVQTHERTADTRKAAAAYFKYAAPEEGILWRKSCKGIGKLSSQMSETSASRALTKRVELLGRHAGIEGLSAHDARHYAATFEARNGTPINRLVDMFGWNSPTMALRYIEAAHIANEGTARVKPI